MINLLPPPPPLPKKKLSLKEKQKLCIWIGIAVIVLMGLFPPVTCRGYRLKHRGRPRFGQVPYSYTGYDFIFKGNAINFGTLITQWAIVSIITGSLIYIFKDKKPKEKK